MGVNPPLHVLENFVPGVHSSNKTPPISTAVEMSWKTLPREGVFVELSRDSIPRQNLRPTRRCRETAEEYELSALV